MSSTLVSIPFRVGTCLHKLSLANTRQPPPPDWLTAALRKLSQTYPNDRFEGTMRYTTVSKETDLPVPSKPNEQPAQGSVKYMYYPRIKCLDCPQKIYTPGPETGVTNFEVHLKNKIHMRRVEERIRKDDG